VAASNWESRSSSKLLQTHGTDSASGTWSRFFTRQPVAAWFGFSPRALNLLPAAQLDGGHITYASVPQLSPTAFPRRRCDIAPAGVFYGSGGGCGCAATVLKLQHPPTLDDSVPLKRRHVVLGWIALILLILCFMPAPIAFVTRN
jgi:membrane-associated protease RseP (regulator of RpoE activity)